MVTLSSRRTCNNCQSIFNKVLGIIQKLLARTIKSKETDQLCFSKLLHDFCNMGSKFLDLELSQYNTFTARSQNSLSKPSGETNTCVILLDNAS